ncbi:MAG: hypothetical protein KDJ29_14440, partial [Hyphomicrobiales bacterium]|nr:hypothetical protein [Hyphomicrobiales bacterium]
MYQRICVGKSGRTGISLAEMPILSRRSRIPRPSEPVEPDYDQAAGRLVVKLVSVLDRVELKDLYRSSRGKAGICLSRQKAMYLMHTVFSSPYHKVAEFFRRDRTTIAHACRLV